MVLEESPEIIVGVLSAGDDSKSTTSSFMKVTAFLDFIHSALNYSEDLSGVIQLYAKVPGTMDKAVMIV